MGNEPSANPFRSLHLDHHVVGVANLHARHHRDTLFVPERCLAPGSDWGTLG